MVMYMSRMVPAEKRVGYGNMGVNGYLGYEDKFVTIKGQTYMDSISAHAQSEIVYELDYQYAWLTVGCAINDTGTSDAEVEFQVWSGKNLLGVAKNVNRTHGVIHLDIDARNVRQVKLVTKSASPNGCHAIWVEPQLFASPPKTIRSITGKVKFDSVAHKNRQYATLVMKVSPEQMQKAMLTLSSLYATNDCRNIPLLIFDCGLDDADRQKLSIFNPIFSSCRLEKGCSTGMSDAVVYRSHYAIDSNYYAVITPGWVFFDNILGLIDIVKLMSPYAVAAPLCKPDQNFDIESAFVGDHVNLYASSHNDLDRFRLSETERKYANVLNSNLFVASKAAMMAMDSTLQTFLPFLIRWEGAQCGNAVNRQHALLNLYACRSKCGIPFGREYGESTENVSQLNIVTIDGRHIATTEHGEPKALWLSNESFYSYENLLNMKPNKDFIYTGGH